MNGLKTALVAAGAATGVVLAGAAAPPLDTMTADVAAGTISTARTVAALGEVPGVLAASASVATRSDSANAAVSATVTIPRQASSGVTMAVADGSVISITPPSNAAGSGVAVAPGVIAYPGRGGSSTAVQATEDGGVRLLTVIQDASAPREYTYGVAVPGGGAIRVNPDGTADVLAADGVVVSGIQAPWATDAAGVSVPTRYTTDGRSLTQHVDLGSGSYAYPVTADPWFWSYLTCILGVGVPAAAAIWFAAEVTAGVAIRAVIAQRKVIPAGGPGYNAMAGYAQRIYNACKDFIKS